MYDIKPLEEEWKKYRKKKRKPLYLAGAGFIVFLVLILFFSNSDKITFKALSSYFITLKNTIENNEDEIPKRSALETGLVMNAPLMRVEMEKQMIEETETENAEESPGNILVDIPILDGQEDTRSNISKHRRSKVHLNIIKTTNVTAYKDVEKRFKQSHDIDDSLFLARSYYKKGNYKKSEYWALQTNKVNPNIEESMLIFVKSKMKLGRKNEARNILRHYVKSSNSQEAKKLLYRIENGKF